LLLDNFLSRSKERKSDRTNNALVLDLQPRIEIALNRQIAERVKNSGEVVQKTLSPVNVTSSGLMQNQK
jgi:hypothetical protein